MAANVDVQVGRRTAVTAAAATDARDEPDRRRCCRFTVNLPALYRSKDRVIDAHIACLSWNGLRLTCSQVDRVETEATVLISLPDTPRQIAVEGSVVWRHVREGELNEMGLSIDAISRDSGVMLANFLLRSNHTRRRGA
jgi:Tfp pilus assembly protein PilZ